MKAGLIGGSSQQRSLPFNAERSVNLFPVLDQAGKDVAALYSKPGNQLFASAGIGPGRGSFTASNGRSFFVSSTAVFELLGNGTTVQRGTVDQSQGGVTIDENGFQLAVCDGQSLYILTYATNAFQKVTTVNLPSASTVTFIDGYFIVNRLNSGIFQISKLYDGLVWAALDFATAESSPDSLLRVLNVSGQLWLFGDKTTEIWSNTGGLKFPFTRIAGAKLENGTSSRFSPLSLDNSAFWVNNDKNGFGIVYRAEGFSPRRISTEAIELKIQSAIYPDRIRSFSYQEDGHTFFILTDGGMETTLVYDLATQVWHERAFLNEDGNYEQDIAITATYAFNRCLVMDRRNGNIYEQSLKYYDDNGEEIARDRTFTHLTDENQPFTYANLTVGFETGVGLQTGLGQDPKATLFLSKDGGKTFSGGYITSIGKAGKFRDRAVWRRLGQARQMTFRVRITDPVKVCISGSWFNTL